MTEPTTTEAQTIGEYAAAAVEPREHGIDGGLVLTGAYPPGWQLHELDLVRYEARPRRKTGTVRVADTDGLLAYIDLQCSPDAALLDTLPTVYYQQRHFTATAVFNGHTEDGAGWGDHRAVLQLLETDEWQAWMGADRRFSTATEFAEFVEEWRHTIAAPATADLLDMVRSFRATTKVSFRQELVDKSGDKALEYVTETEAKAGATGKLEIPDGFDLMLAPFEGAEARHVRARFRYRLDGGQAVFGVVLEQPALMAKAAFRAELTRIEQHAPFVLINGQP